MILAMILKRFHGDISISEQLQPEPPNCWQHDPTSKGIKLSTDSCSSAVSGASIFIRGFGMKQIDWLFFDVGSTLVNEEERDYQERIKTRLLLILIISYTAFYQTMIHILWKIKG